MYFKSTLNIRGNHYCTTVPKPVHHSGAARITNFRAREVTEVQIHNGSAEGDLLCRRRPQESSAAKTLGSKWRRTN